MTSRRLLILSLVSIVAIGAGLWLASRQSSSRSEDSYEVLYPALKKELDSVTAVRIFKPGDARAVELERKESGWVVNDRHGYPADEPKLHKLLLGIADAKLYEEKTANPAQYPNLGVEEMSNAAAGGVRIELTGPPQPVNLIVGKQGIGGQSHYVRRAGEPQSWLINASIDTSASPDAWLRKDVIDISTDRIQSVVVDASGGKSYTAAKKSRADANFEVTGLPKGKELSSDSAANGLATALAAVTLADVQPAGAFESAPPVAQATFRTFDGLVAHVQGWTKDDKHYIAMKTSFDAAQVDRFKAAAAPEEKKADAKPDTEAADANAAKKVEATKNVEDEAKTANAKLAGWVYEIPEYKYEGIFKPLEQLVKSGAGASAAR